MGLITIQVTRLRKFLQATAVPLSPDGAQLPRRRTLAVSFPDDVFAEVKAGTVWQVEGEMSSQAFDIGGWEHTEDLLIAKRAIFKRLSGDVLAFYLSKNVDGIGSVIAKRVARTEKIAQIILENDVARLCQISGVNEKRASMLIRHWPDNLLEDAIEWIQSAEMSPRIARKMIEVFGPKAIETVKQNPFLLVSLGATWKEALALAKSLGMDLYSPQVLCAVAERAAANLTKETGDISVSEGDLKTSAFKLIKRKKPLELMVETAIAHNVLIRVGDVGLIPMGTATIEDKVARTIAQLTSRSPGVGSMLAEWEKAVTEANVRESLLVFESSLSFALTDEQREAVVGAVLAPIACISGGAGTGKTTILRAILGVYEVVASGIKLKQVALSGRAAQRMAESSGYEACTIAKLIADYSGKSSGSPLEHVLLVIDEASMVDLFSMYRLCSILPRATRILFVGDTAQLPPVGPGLIFHSLTRAGMPLPTFRLSQVKRQASESGIHRFATAVRKKEMLVLPHTNASLIDSEDASIEKNMTLDRAYELWCKAGGRGEAMMLSPVRKGSLGVDAINIDFQKRHGGHRPLVKNPRIPHFEWRNRKGQWLFEGDSVMVNQNDYDLDVRNGDLGYISEVYESIAENGSAGIVVLDSGPVPLSYALLEKLELAYAITVHKSQGSQWKTVILTLPPEASRMMDQTLLYTGATRPQERLVIMGEQSMINAAVMRGNVALRRKVCVGGLVEHHRMKLECSGWNSDKSTNAF